MMSRRVVLALAGAAAGLLAPQAQAEVRPSFGERLGAFTDRTLTGAGRVAQRAGQGIARGADRTGAALGRAGRPSRRDGHPARQER